MNPQFKRNLIGVAVASCFAGTAYGNPIGPAVVNGSVGFSTAGKALTVTNSPGSIIHWQSFSIAADEATRFIQQSAASSVLNRVVGVDPSAILGLLQSNGRVFLINPSGILFGATARIDVPGFVASTLDLSNADFLNGRFNFAETPGAAGIRNEGSITTSTGGFVYLVATDIQNSGIITSPQGEVILAAGKSVELVNPGSPDIRVVLTAPDNQAINVGSIIAKSGRIGIYGGLISQQGVVNANTAVRGENGEIILKATQDVTLDPGSVTTASGEGGGVKDGGEIRLVADGTLTVAQDAQVLARGGNKGGAGGFIELSGQHVALGGQVSVGVQPGNTLGSVLIDPLEYYIQDGATGCGGLVSCITPAGLLGFDGNVTIAADANVFVKSPIADGNVTSGASLTLVGGNLVAVQADIGTPSARFNHELNLVSGDDVNIVASIYQGANSLNISANVAPGVLTSNYGITPVDPNVSPWNDFDPIPGHVVIGPLESPSSVMVDTQGSINISGNELWVGAIGNNAATVRTTGDLTVNMTGLVGIGGSSLAYAPTLVTARDINVNAPIMGIFGDTYGGTGSVKLNATNDINLNLSGSTCVFGECGALGIIGGYGGNAFAEVTAGNDIKIRAADPNYANVAVWGGGDGAYAKLRAGRDIVLDLQPSPSSIESFGGGWLDVMGGWGNNAYAEASAGRDIKSWNLVTNGSGGLDLGSTSAIIGGVIVEGGSAFGAYGGGTSIGAGNITATLSAGYNDAGNPVPVAGGYGGSISLNLAYGAAVLGGDVYHALDGAEGGASIATDASALMRAAKDITLTVAGTGPSSFDGAAVMIAGGSASAEVRNALGGAVSASAKADATLMAYGGAVSITVTNGDIAVFGGDAHAEAMRWAAGTADHQATAQAKTKISAATNVTLDAQNGSVAIHGGIASADTGHDAYWAAGTYAGDHTATAYGGLTISAGVTGTVLLHGAYGADIDAGYGGAFAFHDLGYGGVVTSGANTASAYGGLGISGGSIAITAENGPINISAPAALAIATHRIESAYGANVNGNNKAYAEFNLAITASGADGITIDAGANSVQLGSGSSIYVEDVPLLSRLPRGAMAIAENNVLGSISGNGIADNNTAIAKAAMSLTSAGPVTISGYDVNIYGQQIAAQAVNNASGDYFSDNSIAGNNIAMASGEFTVSGTSVVVTAKNTLSVSGGGADAEAFSRIYAFSGALSSNAINASAATNLNKAEAYGGVTFNATGTGAYGGLTLSADNGSLNIYGGGANATAYKEFDNSSGSGNVMRGDNTAWAENKILLKSNSGNVDVKTTSGTGQVQIGNWWYNNTNANAYNEFSGYGGAISGAHNATATGGMEISAGATSGTVNIASYGGYVQIYGPWRNASAYNTGNAASNFDVSGSNTATVNSGLKVAGMSVSVTAGGSGWLTVSGGGAGANAYSRLADGAFDNFVDTANTATVNGGVTFNATAGNLTFSAANGSVNIYGGEGWGEGWGWGWGWAQASKEIANLWWGEGSSSASATGNELLGDNTASASNKMTLKASGNVDIETTGGTGQVYISTQGGMATAHNGLWAVGGTSSAAVPVTVADNVLSGNNEATLTGDMDITAGTGGTVTIASYGGNVYVNALYVSAEAGNDIEGGGSATLSGNSITGNNAAKATATLNATGGAVTVSANQSLFVFGNGYYYGSGGTANAHSLLDSSGAAGNLINASAATNLNKAEAYGGVTFDATGGNLTLSAANGSLYINGSGANADAYKEFYNSSGGGNIIRGGNTAWAENKMVLKASGDVDIKTTGGTGQVYVSNNSTYADAHNNFGGPDGGTLAGNNSATANGGMEIVAGAKLTVASYGGSVILYASDATAQAYTQAYGATVTGANKATANSTITLSGGSIALTAGSGVNISAESAYALASGDLAAADNMASADASISITSTSTTGSLAVDAGSGKFYVYAAEGDYAEANASGRGTNTANADANVTLNANGNLTVNADNGMTVYNYWLALASASGGSAGAVNKATANANATLHANGTLTVTAPNGGVKVWSSSGASAFAVGYGGNIATANGNASMSAGGALTITAGSDIEIQGAYWDDNSAVARGDSAGAVNTATAKGNASVSGQSVTIATSGDVNIFGASSFVYAGASGLGKNLAMSEGNAKLIATGALTVTGGDVFVDGGSSAYAYTSGTGDNRATARSTATLNAGSLTVAGGGLYVNGGYASASHSGAGAPVADASATVNSGVVNVSGDVYLNGGRAYTFTSGAGAPKASANASILMGAGDKTMTIGGGLGLFGGFTDFTGAGTPSAYALIDPGQLTITTGDNVILEGGSGVNTFASLHALGPIVLNIGGSGLMLFGGSGSGLFAGTGSNITVSFTSGTGAIAVDNTCLTCGAALVKTEPTAAALAFTPPRELFQSQEAPTTPGGSRTSLGESPASPGKEEEEEGQEVSGAEQPKTQEKAPKDKDKPTCS